MSRTTGTYSAPSNSWNPAVEGTPVDETDWNTTLQDIEDALTESTYTAGLGATDNQLVRTDGTDTKKVQGTGITVDDSNNVSGVGTLGSGAITSTGTVTGTALSASTSGVTTTGTVELGHATDTTLARSGAGDITIEGKAVYRADGTDVPLADGGTGASLSDPGADRLVAWDDSASSVAFIALADLTAEAAPATGDMVLIYGAEGDLRAVDWGDLPGAGVGSGDVVGPASSTDNAVVRFNGAGGTSIQDSGVIIDDSDNVSGVPKIDPASGITQIGGLISIPQGRLTVATGTPVVTTTVSANTTIFYTPYVGRLVPIYDGTRFHMHDVGGELSQATTDSTKSPAAATTNSNYDLFVWNDSGTYRCTRGPAWSTTSARGTGAGTTEIEYINGILVNAEDITNGPAANRGTYVGTIRTNGSSQVDWIFGSAASGGGAGFFGLWNMYNRVRFDTMVRDTAVSWTNNSATVRAANNSATARVSFVRGLNEDGVRADYFATGTHGAAARNMEAGVGLDVTNAHSGWIGYSIASATGNINAIPGGWAGLPGLGFHFVSATESSAGTGNVTFYGGGTSGVQPGFVVTLMA